MTVLTSSSPGLIRSLDARAGLLVPFYAPDKDFSILDLGRAALEQENIFGSLLANQDETPRDPPVPGFNPVEGRDPTKTASISNPFLWIEGYEEYTMDFYDARSPGDIERIKRRIDRELENRMILRDAGAYGFIASMAAAILDPLIFIPGVGIAKSARGAVLIGRTMARTGALGGGLIAVQEAALHMTQRTRTPQESALNIAGGVVLAGLLGGAIGKLTQRQLNVATKQIDEMTRMLDVVDDVPPERFLPGGSAGGEIITPQAVARRQRLTAGVGGLIEPRRAIGRVTPKPTHIEITPRRISNPNDLRTGQQVTHPKFGEGEVVGAPGHKPPKTKGVSEFNEAGRGLHNGMIVRLKNRDEGAADFAVRIIEVFRVGTKRLRAEDALIRQNTHAQVSIEPAGKVRVELRDGTRRIIDLTDIEGINKVNNTGRFNTVSELVEVAFAGGRRRVKASLLTTRVGAERRAVNSFTANAGDVMDGTVPDPLAPGGLEIGPIGPVHLPDPLPITREKIGPEVKAMLDDGTPDSTTTFPELAKAAGGRGLIARASFFGYDFNALAKWINPRLQAGMSRLKYMTEVAQNLIEIPVRFRGDRVKVPSAEARTRIRRAEAEVVKLRVRELYLQHLTNDPNAKLTASRIVFGFGQKRTGKLTETEFWEEITKSLRGEPGPDGKAVNFDLHEIAEVQQATKLIRDKIINPIREDLIDLGVLPKEVRDFPGYMTRLYNNNKLRNRGERENFIDAIQGYQLQVHIQKGLPVDEFNAGALRTELNKVVDTILAIHQGRMFPGDVSMRGPMLERTLDVPDAVIAAWLVNDGERLINYYVRSLVGDIEIIKRFGLIRERDFMKASRANIIESIRGAEKPTDASLKARNNELLNRHGGKTFRGILKSGDSGRGIKSITDLKNVIKNAKTDAKAMEALEAYDDNLMQSFSTADMFLQLDRLENQWNKRITQVNKISGNARKLVNQKQRDIANIRLGRDEVRGLAGIPDDPTAWAPRFMRGLRMWTYMAVGGKIALSSIPDLALPVMNHGFVDTRAFGGMMSKMLGDWQTVRLARQDAEFALGPSELVSGARANRLNEIEQEFAPQTAFGRGLAAATQKFSIINLMGPWNQAMRTFGTMTSMNFIIASSRRAARGEALNSVTIGRLAELGLSEKMMPRIFEQFMKHGGEGAGRGGRRIDFAPNIRAWSDIEVRELMRDAVYRSYDMNLIKGGVLDRPRFIREMAPGVGDELSKTILFFLNFGLAANTRILSRGLQFKDAAFASGASLSVALGALAVYLKWQVSGREDPPADSLAGWVKLSVQQSGVSGFVFDVDRIVEQATLGRVGLSSMFNTRGTRYYSPQTAYEAVFGLPVGQLLHATFATAGLIDLDPDKGDVIRFRRMIPGNNVMGLSRIFDAVQERVVREVR